MDDAKPEPKTRLETLGINTSAIPKLVLMKHEHFDSIWEGKVKDTIYLPKLLPLSVLKRQTVQQTQVKKNEEDVKD